MEKFIRRNKQDLDTIEESAENSIIHSSSNDYFQTQKTKTIKSSLIKKGNKQEDQEKLKMSKLPKYLSSASINNQNNNLFTTDNRKENYQRLPTFTEPNYPVPNIRDNLNNNIKNRNSMYQTQPQSNLNKLNVCNMQRKINNILLISNFSLNSFQKVFNEFKKFGDIKEYVFDDKDLILAIEYVDPFTAIEAFKNYNPKIADKRNGDLNVILNNNNEIFKSKNYLKEPEIVEKKKIKSPCVSYYNQIIDLIFNW
jgi:hypothetical protein